MHLLKDINNCHHTIYFFLPILQYDPFAEHRPQKISDREDEYKKRRQKMIISPERHDPFADGKFYTIFFSVYFICLYDQYLLFIWRSGPDQFCFCLTLRTPPNNLLPGFNWPVRLSQLDKSFNGMCWEWVTFDSEI